MLEKMIRIKEDVRELLAKYPHYRDSDTKLIAAFYYKNYGGNNAFSKITAIEFLKRFANNDYVLPDAITRVRRKLQEEDESLRGEKYKNRHSEEEEVRTNIHNL
jgi:hypothetical protein